MRDIIANIIDPHSFLPDNSGCDLTAEMVRQGKALAYSKTDRIFEVLASADLGANTEPTERDALETLDAALSVLNGCVHDGGFDREIGPIGCNLGDKCVCLGIYPLIVKAREFSEHQARVDQFSVIGADWAEPNFGKIKTPSPAPRERG